VSGAGPPIGQTVAVTADEGWEPIEVRNEDDTDAPPQVGLVRHLALASDPIIGPGPDLDDEVEVTLPRLARHSITLEDGHEVGVAICGRGVPLVVVHGFSAEGILYAQTLSRLVDLGFKVIAIDTAGHGGTLGVREAVLVGHSMGGRLVTELAANDPDRAIAVILLDAIVGDTWDRMVNLFRVFPPLLVGVGVTLLVDTVTTVPWFRDPRQAAKLGSLVGPTVLGHVRRPWRLLGPAASILRSPGTKGMLDMLRRERIPVFAVHGDRDLAVPLATSKDAARRARGDLVVVRGATHSWLLKDPETLPAIMLALMRGRLGTAVLKTKLRHGVDLDDGDDAVEAALYAPDALVLQLTPRQRHHDTEDLHRKPRYRWRLLPARDPRD
jgi:pimeloyl-ACP methyl ester carboxylesterase